MKILVAHNLYRSNSPSGENLVVVDEIAALRARGVAVSELLPSSDDISLRSPVSIASVALGPVYSTAGVKSFRQLLENDRPDVIHLHNLYPLISPAIIRDARKLDIPVVQTVHNYRHSCVKGTRFRDGGPCSDCSRSSVPWPAVVHRCYRDSVAQSLSMAAGQVVHRSTWRLVDRFIVLTQFMADELADAGIDRSKLIIRPTSIVGQEQCVRPDSKSVLFVGRLDGPKGIRILLEAWSRSILKNTGWRLEVAGDGPLRDLVQNAALQDSSIAFLGPLGGNDIADAYRRCKVVAIPSVWFEGYPRVLAEALSHARPVIVSNIGGLGTSVSSSFGLRVMPTVDGWLIGLDSLPNLDLESLGARGLTHWRTHLAPESSIDLLLSIYEELLEGR